MRRVCFAAICCLVLLFGKAPAGETKVNSAKRFCAFLSLRAHLRNSSAVFVGEVLSETKNGNEKTFEFRVEKYWKGAGAEKISVSVFETTSYQSWFRVGKKYLVFARANEDGRLRDGKCSASKLLSEASKELRALGRAKIPR